MKRTIRTEKLKENALVAFVLALQLAQDQEFRERVGSALEHSKKARRRAGPGHGIAGATRRIAADQTLQAELQRALGDLERAYALAVAKKRRGRLRRITPLAALASLAAVPEVRERVFALIATASRNPEHLHGIATGLGKADEHPNSLDDLTKEELYARAQEAGISGRSEMSKDELVTALRNKS